ncbi:MAG: hypothetical protein HFF01_03460 [Erysipelotrichaceae bacterium]|nr:hypothetical protein [Erysipelotrichaceae bacterium]MCI9524090.1 hypothetical protein [Erysipelotrichaceae bacterium]
MEAIRCSCPFLRFICLHLYNTSYHLSTFSY